MDANGPGSVNLAVALAVTFGSFVPMWSLVVWMGASSSPPWRWIAERSWLKCVAWVTGGIASVVVGNAGSIWAYYDLLGPGRPSEQRLVYWIAVGMQFAAALAIAWVQERRIRSSGGRDSVMNEAQRRALQRGRDSTVGR